MRVRKEPYSYQLLYGSHFPTSVSFSSGMYSTISSIRQWSALQIFPKASIEMGSSFPIRDNVFVLICAVERRSVRFIFLSISIFHKRLYDQATIPPPFTVCSHKMIISSRRIKVNSYIGIALFVYSKTFS